MDLDKFAFGDWPLSIIACFSQAESAWRHHRNNLGATGRSLSGSYESEYWKFIQSRFVGVWRHVVASLFVLSCLANLLRVNVNHAFGCFDAFLLRTFSLCPQVIQSIRQLQDCDEHDCVLEPYRPDLRIFQ